MSNKIFKSVIAIAMVLIMTISFKIDARASRTYEQTNPYGFSEEWEQTVYYKDSKSNCIKMVYGFNMFAINEDYTWTYSYYPVHKAGVINANGTFWSGTALCTRWAKKEVIHSGSSVTYTVWVDDDRLYSSTTPVDSNIK